MTADPTTSTADPQGSEAPDHGHGTAGHAHPSEWEYIKIAIILAVITAAEVAVYYVPSLEGLLVPILAVFSTVKFVLVVMWFMHLRFDSKLFRRLFVAGLVLALFCFTVVLATFHVFTR